MNVSDSNQFGEPLDLTRLALTFIFGVFGLLPLLSFRIIVISEQNMTISIGVEYFFVIKKTQKYQFSDFDHIKYAYMNRTYSSGNNPAPIGVRHSTTTKETDLLFLNSKGRVVFDLKNIENNSKTKHLIKTIRKIKSTPNNND